MKQRLIVKQSLQQKLNQSLIQSLQLLQFNSMELHDYINELALENPLIEEVIYDTDMEEHTFKVSAESVSMDINPAEKNFYELIKEQLIMLDIPDELKPLIEFGIDSLNEAGYLELSMEDWAHSCETTLARVEEALTFIQKLEPIGIGARSLGECLLIQIRQRDAYEAYMEDALLHHLDWIADLNVEALMEVYDIDEEDISTLMKLIQSCNPRPGEIIDQAPTEYIVPEAKVYQEDSEWKITFYNWSSPTIIINQDYAAINDTETTAFLKGKKEQIAWLQTAIQYRSSTIESVIYHLVEEQVDFLENGILKIKPLRLADIATKLDLHVSTISRTVNDKYIDTPHGILSLKFFFQAGMRKGENEVASIVIKNRIMELVEKENKTKPLSDQKIKDKLAVEFGIILARRTVMKYRQSLNIVPSYKRKEKK